ncbi:MAG: M23 family metallopeptidase [Desulfobacterales bacterium]
MRFKRKEKGKRLKLFLVIILGAAVIGPGGWFLWTKYEGSAPEIDLDLKKDVIGAETEISCKIKDRLSGVRKLWVGLIRDGEETVLLEKSIDADAEASSGAGRTVDFNITINTEELGISDGPAVLRIVAWDHSWRNWWKGNVAYLEKELAFDTRPPRLTVLTNQHNVAQGGSGLVAYRLSETCEKSGVYVGEEFFPGYSGYFEDEAIYVALFALPYDHSADTDLYVKAEDAAGNTARSGFYHYIRKQEFKTDILPISDRFLEWKMPEFEDQIALSEDASLIDKFLYVNRKLRKKNNQTLLDTGGRSEPGFLWQGAFDRLPNSARRANFADHRVYTYNGENIDQAVHMGIDLASIRHADVPAANAGKVVFAGEIGIYGNTVVIDHGFGLFSVYSHLSRINLNQGERVAKGEIIGNTGTSGLAGGDHLHYGMFINHVYVNPVEWWDGTWIAHNITSKLDNIESMSD